MAAAAVSMAAADITAENDQNQAADILSDSGSGRTYGISEKGLLNRRRAIRFDCQSNSSFNDIPEVSLYNLSFC